LSPPSLLDPADPAGALALRPWLALQSALCFRPDLAVALLHEHGDPERALRASGAPPIRASDVEASLATLRRVRAVGVPLSSVAYPRRLARYPEAAPLLLVQGDPAALAAPGIAIVGSRAATQHGLALAREFATELARAGLVVISGLARGIDAAVHAGALDAGGRTIAVQACGPDLVSGGARRLASRICRRARGHGFPPMRRAARAPRPHRSIMALPRHCSDRGGASGAALVTTGHSGAGPDVFALPGPLAWRPVPARTGCCATGRMSRSSRRMYSAFCAWEVCGSSRSRSGRRTRRRPRERARWARRSSAPERARTPR
jgi:DNA processing protein